MTAHPLSLRRQILLLHDFVQEARFEFSGDTTRFFVKHEGVDVHAQRKTLVHYLNENRAVGTHAELAEDWVDGPPYPDMFAVLSDRQRELLASCDTTEGGLQALLLTALPWLRDVETSTPRAGHVAVVVAAKGGRPTPALLKEVEQLTLAAVAAPGIAVEVRVGPTTKRSAPKFPLIEILINQASRDGVHDGVLRRTQEEDEDYFREARERGFTYRDSTVARDRWRPSVFVPGDGLASLHHLVAFYETIYLPVSLIGRENGALGCTQEDLIRTVELGRCVPVFDQRLGRYNSDLARRLVEAGRYVTPRQLTVRIASDLLSANPLWRLASEDPLLVREAVRTTEKEAAVAGVSDGVSRFFRAWTDHQLDGAVDFHAAVLNQGADVSVRFGAGALVGRMLFGEAESIPRGMLGHLGRPLAVARALDAACVPHVVPAPLERLADTIAAAASPAHLESLDQVASLRKLDQLLEAVSITCPHGVPIAQWIDVLSTSRVDELRGAMRPAFEDSDGFKDVGDIARELAKEVQRVAKAQSAVKRTATKLQLVGVVADFAAYALDTGFPLTGTAVGLALSAGIPRLWAKLEASPTLRTARDAVEAKNALSRPHAVRLCRLGQQIRSDLTE